MRRRHTRGGGTKVPPASCESPPLPSGRAARARVSNAFRLPPGCHCDRQGIGCHLRTVRVPFTASVGARNARPHTGTRPERRLHGNGKYKPHIDSSPRPRGQAQNRAAATLSQIKFFHRMWTNLFAVAGTREHPLAGVIRKRGRSAPSCARGGRAGRKYAGK